MTQPLRILFCCPHTVTARLGASKVYIEVAAALREEGWETTLVGPEDTGNEPTQLRDYLRANAAKFDVVEYEHNRLPIPRNDFPSNTLMVARSVLLSHHFLSIPIPPRPRLKSWLGHVLFYRSRRARLKQIGMAATMTCREADLVAVPTIADADALTTHGIDRTKIVVLPFALSQQRRDALATAATVPITPTIAFVGTFDPRKGMCDFPAIARRVLGALPHARFRLIGTRGLLHSAEEVLATFAARHRAAIEVIPEFDPAELPKHLSGCAVGLFPSLIEGFPFGVLEMLAAGLPVIAYRVPGPPEMLPDEYLAPVHDVASMAAKLVALLVNPERLAEARRWAMARAAEFRWDEIGRQTAERYTAALKQLRSRSSP